MTSEEMATPELERLRDEVAEGLARRWRVESAQERMEGIATDYAQAVTVDEPIPAPSPPPRASLLRLRHCRRGRNNA